MSYASEVLADSPAGWWRHDETSGLMQDSSGNANHATAGQTDLTYGESGAILADPSSKSIRYVPNRSQTVPDHATLDLGDVFTIELWWKFNVNGIDQWPVTKQTDAYEMRINAANTFSLVKASIALIVTSTITIPNDGQFHHLVATKNGATSKLYLDGTDVTGTVTDSTCINNASVLHIGDGASGGQYCDGWLDEVAVYPTALSPVRVSAHYNAAITTPGSDLRASHRTGRGTSW